MTRRRRARQLARILESECGDAAAALVALEEALADEPGDLELLAEIERLAAATDAWAGAADALRGALGPHGEGGRREWRE